jgi:hypothetical protein
MNMYNQFAPNPYIQQGQQQDIGGLSPVFQNIAAQQAAQNAALQQGMNLTNQAGMTNEGKQAGVGMDQMALAAMLRKKPDQAEINAQDVQMGGLNTYNPFTQYQISQEYGTNPFSESSRMIAAQNSGFK